MYFMIDITAKELSCESFFNRRRANRNFSGEYLAESIWRTLSEKCLFMHVHRKFEIKFNTVNLQKNI